MSRVLVFGSINTDFVTYVERFPNPGETVTGVRFQLFSGGKGANQAVAAARAGANVEIFGCIGDDSFGKESLKSLKDAGISVRNVIEKSNIPSGIAQIMVDVSGENIIAIVPGANDLFTLQDITLPQQSEGTGDISILQNEIPQDISEAIIKKCKRQRNIVIWNTAPALTKRPSRETLKSVDFLICNQEELKAYLGEGSEEALAIKLQDCGVRNVIITLGNKGSLLVSDKTSYYQRAFPSRSADAVGAGDCFCGVFACSLSFGIPVRESIRRASAAAALSTTIRGAQTSMPTINEINKFLSQF